MAAGFDNLAVKVSAHLHGRKRALARCARNSPARFRRIIRTKSLAPAREQDSSSDGAGKLSGGYGQIAWRLAHSGRGRTQKAFA